MIKKHLVGGVAQPVPRFREVQLREIVSHAPHYLIHTVHSIWVSNPPLQRLPAVVATNLRPAHVSLQDPPGNVNRVSQADYIPN